MLRLQFGEERTRSNNALTAQVDPDRTSSSIEPGRSAMLSALCTTPTVSMMEPENPDTTATRRKHVRELFRKYSAAMAYVVVAGQDGKEGIGSAFHVGEGVYVTARHVVEGFELKEVRPSEPVGIPTKEFAPNSPENYDEMMRERLGFVPTWKHYQDPLASACAPVFHHDTRIDIAAFAVRGLHKSTPTVTLGRASG